MPKLYEIATEMRDQDEQILALDRLLDESGGDISDPDAAAYVEQLFAEQAEASAANEQAFNDKVDRIVAYIKNQLALADARSEQAAELAAFAQTTKNKADGLKRYLHGIMIERGIPVAGHIRQAKITKNGGKLPVHIDVEPDSLPEGYQVVTVKADVDEIRDALASSVEVPGCRLGERGTHLGLK